MNIYLLYNIADESVVISAHKTYRGARRALVEYLIEQLDEYDEDHCLEIVEMKVED